MTSLQAHYDTLRDRHDLADPGAIDAAWFDPALRRRFVAVDGVEVVESAMDCPTIACMGAGMTGPPHLGTVGQLLTAIELQQAGLDVQFVLADLEPYHGGGDAEQIKRLAERYRAFALDLGFDPERGLVRTQSEATEVMATGHRLARHYRPDAWVDSDPGQETAWEAAVQEAYAERHAGCQRDAEPRPTSDAAAAHSAVLHGADFLHPLVAEGYEQLLLAFGADEYGLLSWTRQFREAAAVDGRIAGYFTRMVPGFGDVPKQSKSIGTGVLMDEQPDEIRERIGSASDPGDPHRSTVFQAMCLASQYDAARLSELEAACAAGGEAWDAARREYAEYVAELAERWQATAG